MMNLKFICDVFAKRNELKQSYSSDRDELLKKQQKDLNTLREFTYSKSAFYRTFHRGLFNAPLGELPVMTKKLLMENYNEIVTDPNISKSEIEAFLPGMTANDYYRGKYIINTTGGTSGFKGIFVYNLNEWAFVIASYSRAYDLAGIKLGPFSRQKIAVVSSTVSWHQSSRVGQSIKTPFISTLRIDAVEPMAKIVEMLNNFNPATLVAYSSMAYELAKEQLSGRLSIHPSKIFCSSEVLSNQFRATIRRAWGREPFNVYAATETAGIGSECNYHQGLHIYEDLVIVESVDANYQPVPYETFGEKLLVTVLFSRTIPLIRYELTDSVMLTDESCNCGLPFKLIKTVQGREEDIIAMKGKDGTLIKVHPNVFHAVMKAQVSGAWQIEQHETNGLKIVLQDKLSREALSDLTTDVKKALKSLGIGEINVDIVCTDALSKTRIGKQKLIQALDNNIFK
ncbi:MAG TPA: hypothetical protein PLV21_03610 [Cyclobacteriaceae bacterium]|nr:hypothetical protein [Cyclobacteriaceae bacterium]HRJ80945.1 hypothetical protein [Cyclobacteriaceae bacterium]